MKPVTMATPQGRDDMAPLVVAEIAAGVLTGPQTAPWGSGSRNWTRCFAAPCPAEGRIGVAT